MPNSYVTSERGLDLIRTSEGTVYHLYNDVANNCTCGTGHLVHLGPICGAASEKPFVNGLTPAMETTLLRQDIAYAEHAVNHLVTVPMTQNEFDALVDFTFNLGAGEFRNSQLLSDLNEGNLEDVPAQIARFDRSGGRIVPALDIRRANEIHLFEDPEPVILVAGAGSK